ncbi:hypothetical protein [Streptomyces collinus]|uniref:hypothetical protein n=1 Tax=Streptomyces collinus TaxID=42684 RepID=UPI002942B693|nr:hypothetical protein [Streptomyces collinus]
MARAHAAAVGSVAQAVALIDENSVFDTARDEGDRWPTAAERTAVLALRHVRDSLAQASRDEATPLQPPLLDVTDSSTRALLISPLENAVWAGALPEQRHERAKELWHILNALGA